MAEKGMQILWVKVGTQEYAALRQPVETWWHLRMLIQCEDWNKWRWSGRGPSQVMQEQQVELVQPFSVKEVREAIQGLNGEETPGQEGDYCFCSSCSWRWLKQM